MQAAGLDEFVQASLKSSNRLLRTVGGLFAGAAKAETPLLLAQVPGAAGVAVWSAGAGLAMGLAAPPPGCTEDGQTTPSLKAPTPPLQRARTFGDPHLVTMDGTAYDFQAAGEFVALPPRSGDFVMQTRQRPWPGSRSVSVNVAVAIGVLGDTIQFDVEGGKLSVTVNGSPSTVLPASLPGGGRVTQSLGTFLVRWPDGSEIAVGTNSWGLTLNAGLAPRGRVPWPGCSARTKARPTARSSHEMADGTVRKESITRRSTASSETRGG